MTDRRRLRIAFVGGSDLHSPDEKQFLEFARQLNALDHEVLMMLREGAPDYGRREEEEASSSLRIATYRLVGRRPRAQDTALVREFAPTLVHAMYPRGTVLAACRYWCRALGVPLFVHFADDEWGLLRGPPDGSPAERVELLVRRAVGRLYPWVWPYATPQWLGFASRSAAAFDAITPALAAEVTSRTGRDCVPLLPAFAKLVDHQPSVDSAHAAAFTGEVALYTGAIGAVHERDVRLALRALAEVQKRGRPIRFVHAGQTDARRPPAKLAREEGMRPDTVTTLGYVPMAELMPLLRRATVLLQPGAPTEFNRLRLPSKMQAYLASGTPTVTFAVGFGELLEDRREVLKTYSADPAELADRIVEVLEDEALRARLAVGGPAAARRLFDPAQNTRALESHYEKALGARLCAPSGRDGSHASRR